MYKTYLSLLSSFIYVVFQCGRGFDELLRQGGLYLRSAILQCQSGKPKGRLLISGTTGDAGLSCGKTSLALLLARELTAYPTCANLQIVECTTLRGMYRV